MSRDPQRICRRGAVLKLGALLGWQPAEVKRFAEELTGVPWRLCGEDELETVLGEYRSIAEAVFAKQRRRLRREAAAAHGRMEQAA